MSRAYGHIAEAVAAVIAEQVHARLHHIPRDLGDSIGADSVNALLADGWYITALPPVTTRPTRTRK